jgi:hypothetical protein
MVTGQYQSFPLIVMKTSHSTKNGEQHQAGFVTEQ